MIARLHRILTRPIVALRDKLSPRHFFIFSSILVGATSALAAIVLKYFVHSIERLVQSTSVTEILAIACLPFVGITLTVLVIKFILGGELKRGSSEIVYSMLKNSSNIPSKNMYAHVLTSGLTVGFGGSVGLESPMVSTGAAIGSNYGEQYGLSYKDKTILLACGSAAGIAAAFNAPIAGVLFAIEVLLADVTAAAFIPLIVSAATGALLSKIILKEGVILKFTLQQPFDYHNTLYYIVLGVVCGLIALTYARVFTSIEKVFLKLGNIWVRVAVGGLLLGGLLLLFPPLFGEGYESIKALSLMRPGELLRSSPFNTMVGDEITIAGFIACVMLFKIVAAAITIGSGGSGGSFAPSLFVGACAGFAFSGLLNSLQLGNIPQTNFTLVAMAGILSGVFYSPLTAIFLIAELTGGYELMIPLMIVSSLSLLVANFFQPLSMESRRLAEKMNGTIDSRDKLLLSRLELSKLIENNFSVVAPTDTLASLTRTISKSSRNIFPVVDEDQKLIGIIHLDKIRHLIFDTNQYDRLRVEELMSRDIIAVETSETLHDAILKFDRSGQWNLPVTKDGKYMGFLSKSTILTSYRKELIEVT